MSRLTKQIPNCPGEYYAPQNRRGAIIDKLGAYEDTGMEPEQVAAMKEENKRLREYNEKWKRTAARALQRVEQLEELEERE